MPEQCRILDYSIKLRPEFERLNREWIEKYFEIEPHDTKCFGDPEGEILKKSGDIFFAELGGEIVGTCALIYDGDVLELAKLAVTAKARGYGIGEALSIEAIRRARAMKAPILRLTTNSRLVPAVKLYEKLGFRAVRRGQHDKYKRVDLVMEIKL
jgi:ribosomal protein S18 acetylase RimI-like enzyme